MTKQEVMKGLKCHSFQKYSCTGRPYNSLHGANNMTCTQHLTLDALNLLKEQENEVEPKKDNDYVWYYCGKCGYEVDPSYENYCSVCGNKIKGEL